MTATPKPKTLFFIPFDPPCRRTRSRLAAASRAPAPQAVVYDAHSRNTRASAGRKHQHPPGPNGVVHRGSSRKQSRTHVEQVKATLITAPLHSAGDPSASSSSTYLPCASMGNDCQSSSSCAVLGSDVAAVLVQNSPEPPRSGVKKGRRRKRAVADGSLDCAGSGEPPGYVCRSAVLHPAQKRPAPEPARPAPHPGVPLELTSPPSHPLPTEVAVLCRIKQTAEYRWCQILDHYQSCGDRWMYYGVLYCLCTTFECFPLSLFHLCDFRKECESLDYHGALKFSFFVFSSSALRWN